MPWIKVASIADIPPGHGYAVEVGQGWRIAVFLVAGVPYAIDDLCTHAEASLARGRLDGRCVTCPRHDARFSLETGAALSPPATCPVRTYPARLVGEAVEIDLAY